MKNTCWAVSVTSTVKWQCDFLKGNITAPSTMTGQMAWYNMILILHYFSKKSKLLEQIEQLYKLHKQPSRSHINGLNIDFFELGTQVAPNSSFHAGSAKCGIFRTSMMLAKFSFLVMSTIKMAHEHPSRQQRTVWNDAVEIADKSLAALKVWVPQEASFWSKQRNSPTIRRSCDEKRDYRLHSFLKFHTE